MFKQVSEKDRRDNLRIEFNVWRGVVSGDDSGQGFTTAVIEKNGHWQWGDEKIGYQSLQGAGWVICKDVETT